LDAPERIKERRGITKNGLNWGKGKKRGGGTSLDWEISFCPDRKRK